MQHINIMDRLSFREQLKLLDLAANAGDYDVRRHALAVLNEYRGLPIPIDPEFIAREAVKNFSDGQSSREEDQK